MGTAAQWLSPIYGLSKPAKSAIINAVAYQRSHSLFLSHTPSAQGELFTTVSVQNHCVIGHTFVGIFLYAKKHSDSNDCVLLPLLYILKSTVVPENHMLVEVVKVS